MNKAFFLQLVFNASLLLTLALIYDLVAVNWRSRRTLLRQVPVGVVIGTMGVIVMLASWKMEPGIIFDTRSILLGVSGLFFGTVPTVVAMAITAVYRGFMGGAAIGMGIAVIFISGAIGIAWRYWRRSFLADITWRELYLFGLIIHLGMLGCTLILPSATRWQVLANIVLPVLLIYPIVTAFLGKLLADHLKRERTKQQLRESEGRYQNLAKIAPVGIFRTDKNGATTYVNPMWCQISGLSKVKAMGAGWLGAVNPDDRESLSKGWQETISLQKPSFADYRFLRPDGTIAWVMGQASPEMNSENEIVGYVGTITDISERKLVESQREVALKTLRESEDLYRDLVENSQDLIYTHDLEGKLLSVNEVAVRLTGYPLKDLLSMNMADLLVPEVRHLFKVYMTEIQATGWARGTMRIRTASGKPRYLEYYNTLRTKGVTVAVVRGLGHDITERERAEKIQHIQYNIADAMIKAETLSDFLETVRNELSSLLDTTNFLLALYDEASGMLSAPFEKDEKDAIPQWPAKKSLTGLVIKQKRSVLLRREEIQQLDEAGATEQIGSNAEAWLGVPLLINEKVLGAIVVQSYDKADAYDQNGVSLLEIIANQLSSYIERKQAESQREAALEALQTAFKENRNLLGELQHRAKNSFAMIFGMISLATSAGVSPETKAALDNLGLRVRSVSELYSLLYSAGSFNLVRLDEYCARIAAPLVGLLGNITLNTEMESITVPVKEAAPLGLILTELMTNAGKYAFPNGRHGTITVALKKTAAGNRLEVRDDGIGLPAGFDFSESAGMGLNLVRSLSGQINGSFRIEGGAAGTRCIVEFAAAKNGSK